MERLAFFCSTPYQVIVASAIMDMRRLSATGDLYVLNHFSGVENLVERLRTSSLFSRVILVDSMRLLARLEKVRSRGLAKRIPLRQLQTGVQYLRYRKIVHEYVDLPEEAYDVAYRSSGDLITELSIKELGSRNTDLQVHLFEDGTRGYATGFLASRWRKRLFNAVTGHSHVLDSYRCLHVFRPELVSSQQPLPVQQVSTIVRNEPLVRLLSEAFGYAPKHGLEDRFIVLEQPFGFVEGMNEKVVEIIRQVIPPNDSIVKMHPLSSSKLYANMRLVEDPGMPWEVIVLNNDMRDQVLITVFSTAAMTPKTIAEQEPHVIFLFDLPEIRMLWDLPSPAREFATLFRSSYASTERVHVPQSVQEFGEVVKRLSKSTLG